MVIQGVTYLSDFEAKKAIMEMARRLEAKGWLVADGSALTLSGREACLQWGMTLNIHTRRKACCACLDWSERRFHPGGAVGAALLEHGQRKGWFTLTPGFREVSITPTGRLALRLHFHLPL